MSVDLSVDLVLNEVGTAYVCTEVRTAAIKLDRHWYNLATVIRCSNQPANIVARTTSNRWKALRNPNGPLLRLHRQVFAGKGGRRTLIRMLHEGVLVFGRARVSLGWTPDLGQWSGRVQAVGSDPESSWPCFDARQSANFAQADQSLVNRLRSAPYAPDLLRHLNTRTYQSVDDVVRRFLGLRDERLEYQSMLQIWLPIYAGIKDVRVQGDTLDVTYECERPLERRVFVHAILREDRNHEDIRFGNAERTRQGRLRAIASLGQLTDQSFVDVQLIDHQLGEVCRETYRKRDLTHPVVVNPLWTLLKRFCTSAAFAGLLARPGSVPEDPSAGKQQRLFEAHVAWLLACFGFQTIWLGKHEQLSHPLTNVTLGTLDLLAYHQESRFVLLGGCTIGAPNDGDYNGLVNMRGHLFSELPEPETPPSYLVIFTAAAACPATKRLHDEDRGLGNDVIHVMDASRLREAVAALDAGNNRWLFEQFADAVLGFHIGQ